MFGPAKLLAMAVILAGLANTAPALAAGSSESTTPAQAADPAWGNAQKAVAAGDFATAIPLLQQIVAKNPDSADAWNYLGYAHSRLGKVEEAKGYYGKALALNPEHRGANEYLGELYLKLGDLPAAEARLKVLDGACFFGCAEYDALKAAVAEYKSTGKFESRKRL